ncbi:hypothetical protein BDM02DRAFT_2192560 [Thelephora ganbajun]|uniref:Uncharacterized protein n=1 Tax=Thelephora ganbajun TaxID=370292 RepID=A0ACB6ZGZ4_THEGA|nr:hypothetical protein BDM02DRAFT_2192560 [Thelephora ganbajun]
MYAKLVTTNLALDRESIDTILLYAQTIMTTPVEWKNTGTFGLEQADLDVAYATSLPPEAALAWVEARLAEVQSHFADLGTKRNNLIPIYHLPKVILFQILSWVALSHSSSKSEKDLHRYPTNQTRDLVHLSQACKLFRNAALERPELWVRVNLENPALAKMFLERSGDKPVTVYSYPPRDTYPIRRSIPLKASTVEILRPHLSRITDLNLTFTIQDRDGYDGGNPLAIHMPALRTLQVRNSWKDEEEVGSSSDSDPQDIPPLVLPTPTDPYPQLRKVMLTSINVPWNSSLFNGLTELELSFQDSGHAPKIEEFITILEQSPGLEKLHLCNSGPKEVPDHPAAPVVKSVQFPHLQDLSIIHDEGRHMDIPLLLSRVSIPLSAKIHIQCNEAVDPAICFSQMFPPDNPFLAELPKYGTLKHLQSFTFFHFRLIDESSGGSLSFRVNRHDQAVQTDPSILDFFQVFGEPAQYVEIYPGSDSKLVVYRSLPETQKALLRVLLSHSQAPVELVDRCQSSSGEWSETGGIQVDFRAGCRIAHGRRGERVSVVHGQVLA